MSPRTPGRRPLAMIRVDWLMILAASRQKSSWRRMAQAGLAVFGFEPATIQAQVARSHIIDMGSTATKYPRAALFAAQGGERIQAAVIREVRALDPNLAAAFAVMIFASIAACSLPAWRATHTDPIRALRAH